jgi:hypothetical protein
MATNAFGTSVANPLLPPPWNWNGRMRVLRWNDAPGGGLRLRLDAFEAFRIDLDDAGSQAIDRLSNLLTALTEDCIAGDERARRNKVAARLALFALWYSRRPAPSGRQRAIENLRTVAAHLAAALGSQDPQTAWHVGFIHDGQWGWRYGLVRAASRTLNDRTDRGSAQSHFPTETDALETGWWTALCQFELATRWLDSERGNLSARNAMIESAANYLEVLKYEPRRVSLERFLAGLGTSSEKEVSRAFARTSTVTCDEAVESSLIEWFLQRYALGAAARLVFLTFSWRRTVTVIVAVLFAAFSVGLFVRASAPTYQTVFQLSALLLIVFGASDVFRLLLPRAMFGSLMAWLTIVSTQFLSFFPASDDKLVTAHAAKCHLFLRGIFADGAMGWWNSISGFVRSFRFALIPTVEWSDRPAFAAVLIVCASVSILFMAGQLTARAVGPKLFRRASGCFLVMLAGSLFWGAMITHPLQSVLEHPGSGATCRCLYSTWILGSFLAVVFGILVQLIWDDRSVTASIGESQ